MTIVKGETEYTIEEVELHNTADDFWTVVDGVVYDLSGYRDKHPGGVIVMNAAGIDSTVLYHTYHLWDIEKPQKVLKSFRIGVLKKESFVSPEMGEFYHKLSARVRAHLLKSGKERRPLKAKVLWVVDSCVMTLMLLSGFFLSTTSTPQWILLVLHLTCLNTSTLRIQGQQHANGHQQIWDPSTNISYGAEVFSYLLGVFGMAAFGLPNRNQNIRKLLNHPRPEAQYEMTLARGYSEHTAIHHVKGADLDDDKCYLIASAVGAFRFTDRKPYLSLVHRFQASFLYQTVVLMIAELADCNRFLIFHKRFVLIVKETLAYGEFTRALALFIGIFPQLLVAWCYLALPCSGMDGFLVYLAFAIVRVHLGMYAVQIFYAQHVWDRSVKESISNKDWGRYNALSTYSWWPTTQDVSRHFFLWGMGNGSCGSTVTYHLEHTLFPGLNYLHLPDIAPIVRSACEECGITYHGLYSYSEVLKTRHEKLALYGYKAKKVL